MPTYEYQCDACGHRFEKFQSIKAAPVRKCPQCGKSAVKRLLGTGAGIIFKGSGFYTTDYRSENYQKAAKAEGGSSESKTETKSETKGDSKSESKPAATTESKPAATKSDSKKKKPK
jgi:putative FmdB family regulatory protein